MSAVAIYMRGQLGQEEGHILVPFIFGTCSKPSAVDESARTK
jgi:hypothetical protein